MNNQNQHLKIWAGLITLYIIWGSTYLGIRFVVESFPPMLISGFRFFLAGFTLLVFSILTKKYQKPSRKMIVTNILSGFFLLTLSNGFFTIAAKWMPSSYSALFSALGPVILVILLWIFEGEKPQKKVVFGAFLGIIGVGILMSLKSLAIDGYENYYVKGILTLFGAVFFWNVGVVIVKKANITEYHATQLAGTQMILGGLISLGISFIIGDFAKLNLHQVTPKAVWAFAYLLTFGSIIGFLVFSWLSKVASPTLVATYTYVNPLVAMFLGWLLAGEKLHPLMIVSGAIIITAVILITSVSRKS
jgi:drug/metabolite transporter (DMT)-like permease